MRGRRVPEYPERELRELIMGNYRLIYMIEPDRVVIVAFIHGARELPPIA